MKKLLYLFFIFTLIIITQADEFINFDNSSNNRVSKRLVDSRGDFIEFDINISGIKIKDVEINGEKYSKLIVDGGVSSKEKGYPELFTINSFLAVPYNSNISAEIVKTEYKDIKINTLISSKGILYRNIDPKKIPYTFNEIYKKDTFFPEEENILKISRQFILRDINGIRVNLTPVRYNPVINKIRIYNKIRVRVYAQASRNSSPFVNYTESDDFNNIYSNVFLNMQNMRDIQAPKEKKDLLIVYADKYKSAAEKLYNFKKKIGFDVNFINYKTLNSPDSLYSKISKLYSENNLCYVLIFGDGLDIPTLTGDNEQAPSDSAYVRLAGDDYVSDAFISRISPSSEKNADYMVKSIIDYEGNPDISDNSWYLSALGVASWEGDIPDCVRLEKLNESLVNKADFQKIYRCYDEIYTDEYGALFENNSPDKSIIFNAINSGVSVVNYMGHGSYDQWVTAEFDYNDVDEFNNENRLPVIWSVACDNGKLRGYNEYNDYCFAECFVQAGGAIGIAASTTLMAWDPPVVWQKHIITQQTVNNINNIASVRNLYGVLQVMKEYGYDKESQGNQLCEQLIYFGDGSVRLRDRIPEKLELEIKKTSSILKVKVSGKIRKNLIVSIYDDNIENVVTGYTDSNGFVTLPYNNHTKLSVYGSNIIPIIDKDIE